MIPDNYGATLAVSTASTTVLCLACLGASVYASMTLWRAYRAAERTAVSDAIASEIRGMTVEAARAHLRSTRPWLTVEQPPKIYMNTPPSQGWYIRLFSQPIAYPRSMTVTKQPAVMADTVRGFFLFHDGISMPTRYI